MNIDLLLQFFRNAERLSDRRSVTRALEQIVADAGFDYYGVIRQPKAHENPMELVLAGRFPDGWPELYIQKKYVVVDPTLRFLAHVQRPFRWREAVFAFRSDPHMKRMQRMMSDGARFGLHDGYIFPVHGRRGLLGNMTVGGRPVDLSPTEIVLLEAFAKKMFWMLIERADPAIAADLTAKVDVALSNREMEVLHLLSDGLTSHEIARKLNISNHTVDWYMNAVQDKLGARNRHHSVAIAFRMGLIA